VSRPIIPTGTCVELPNGELVHVVRYRIVRDMYLCSDGGEYEQDDLSVVKAQSRIVPIDPPWSPYP
jgi:hypothetical protein